MSVEQHDVVDFVSLDLYGNCVLTISDHLAWDMVDEHLFSLQEKLNAYLRFVESGEIYQNFPKATGLPIIISVMLKFPAPIEAQWFFEKANADISQAGFRLETRQFSD